MTGRFCMVAALLLTVSCTTPSNSGHTAERAAWDAPPLSQAVSIRDGRTGRTLSLSDLLDALAGADVVFVGESHTDETTHRVELATYEGLLRRRGGHVVLAMEMFERDAQPALDAYVRGEIDEAAFLDTTRTWSNYDTAYRPLIERAKLDGRPVVASNFPRSLRRRIATDGADVLNHLQGEEARLAPAELLPSTPAYWRRVDNAVRGHLAMMRGGGGDDERLYSTQSLWDNSMGAACATALDDYPGSLVLHVNGGFHSDYWDGTVHQLRKRKPHAAVKTVSIVPVANPAVAKLDSKTVADYVVFAEARATDLNDGKWSVYVSREIEYRFHLPAQVVSDAPVPLMIWLSDDGLTAVDGMELWKSRLGDDVAIAVIEAPYVETQEDLGRGGRWFWPDAFPEDIGLMSSAVERIWGYLLRHYPVDPTRVCLAGEGTGATVVSAVTLLTERMSLSAIAFSPRKYAKIKDFPLPLPELRGTDPAPAKSLVVVTEDADRPWWEAEFLEYAGIGFDSRQTPITQDPWTSELSNENMVRETLGLTPRSAPAAGDKFHLVVSNESARARHWARLWANRQQDALEAAVAVVSTAPAEGASKLIPTRISPESLSEPGALPRCPGPFGGTTVVVLSADMPADETAQWMALEDNDPIHKSSRFHRLRIATAEGDRSLNSVLGALFSEDRKNVLIVPAAFCADPWTLRGLKRSVSEHEDRMTLHWLPGLGGQNIPISSKSPS